tara:strand:+ start:80 stop:382 length:303 start_codon:yes stop_codon:yes gene_type:complete
MTKVKGKHGGARVGSGRKKVFGSKQAYNDSKKLGYRLVYLLDNGYVGSTSNPYMRMAKHKSLGVNPSDSYDVLFASYDASEALRVEREYHKDGYLGATKK